jgi:hypothetical protein
VDKNQLYKMLSDPGYHGGTHPRQFEEPSSAEDALSSLKRSLTVNLNEKERARNKEQQAREELAQVQKALALAESDLIVQKKESAALRSQLDDRATLFFNLFTTRFPPRSRNQGWRESSACSSKYKRGGSTVYQTASSCRRCSPEAFEGAV